MFNLEHMARGSLVHFILRLLNGLTTFPILKVNTIVEEVPLSLSRGVNLRPILKIGCLLIDLVFPIQNTTI
jgi:hypothetical protein